MPKISQLTPATDINAGDLIPVVQNGETKKLDFNDLRLPLPDFDSGWIAIGLNQTLTINHNLGVEPSKVEALIKPDGASNGASIIDAVSPRPLTGIFSSGNNGHYRTTIEGFDATTINIKTGNKSIWYGAASGDYFNSGYIRVMAWK